MKEVIISGKNYNKLQIVVKELETDLGKQEQKVMASSFDFKYEVQFTCHEEHHSQPVETVV